MPGRVTGQELDDRLRIMDELKKQMFSRYMQMMEGNTELLLPEKKTADGYWEGWTGNYIRCRVKKDTDLSGRLIPIRFVRMTEKGIYDAEISDKIL
jgi:tRNA A37 methylthiotransferase MiaB